MRISMSETNTGQILIRSILSTHLPGIKTGPDTWRLIHWAEEVHGTCTRRGSAFHRTLKANCLSRIQALPEAKIYSLLYALGTDADSASRENLSIRAPRRLIHHGTSLCN